MLLLPFFFVVAYALFGSVCYLAITQRGHDRLFAGLASVTLLALRLPAILYNNELDPDESQALTQAITAARGGVYMRDFETATVGPLGTYLPATVGALLPRVDYVLVHGLAAALSVVVLATSFWGMRLLTTARLAQWGAVMLVAGLGLTYNTDFLSYSSEILSLALCSGALAWVIWIRAQPQVSVWAYVGVGLLLGLLPLAKLQALPPGAAIAAGLLLHRHTLRSPGKSVALVLGGCMPTALLMLYLFAQGTLTTFWIFYVQTNLQYASWQVQNTYSGHSLAAFVYQYFIFLNGNVGLYVLLPTVLALLGALYVFVKRPALRSTATLATALWLLALWGAGWFAVVKPGSFFGHYLHYALLPSAYLFVFSLSVITDAVPSTARKAAAVALVGYYVAVSAVVYYRAVQWPFYRALYSFENGATLPTTPVAQYIAAHTAPNEGVAIWWRHAYLNVLAQRPQAVSENHAYRCAVASPVQARHLNRYITDLRTRQPRLFVDASGEAVISDADTTPYVLARQPALKAFVQQHYVLTKTIGNIRLYTRKTTK